MKKKISLMLFIIITFIFISFSTTNYKKINFNKIDGQIIDMITKETLVGVKIDINDKIIYTDLNGKFSIYVNNGMKEIKTDYISYKEHKTNLYIKNDTVLIIEIPKI